MERFKHEVGDGLLKLDYQWREPRRHDVDKGQNSGNGEGNSMDETHARTTATIVVWRVRVSGEDDGARRRQWRF